MPIGHVFGVLRRRWLLVLVGFLMTVGLSGAAYEFFKPTYEITGTVLVLPPPSSLTKGTANPYLQLGGLGQAVDLVGVALSDQTTQLELMAISKDVQYTAKQDVNSSSPLLLIDVKDSSADTALRIRDILVARAPQRLQAMQDALAVNANDRVTTTVVTLDVQAVEVGRNRLRAGVVAACLGLGLTLVAVTMWDAYRLRHPRRRRPARRTPDTDEEAALSMEDDRDPADLTAGTRVSLADPFEDLDAVEERADASGAH